MTYLVLRELPGGTFREVTRTTNARGAEQAAINVIYKYRCRATVATIDAVYALEDKEREIEEAAERGSRANVDAAAIIYGSR